MKRVVPGLVVVGLLVSGCSGDPTASEEYEELEDQLAAAQQQLAEVTVERDDFAGQLAAEIDRPFDLEAFASAQGSGDADQIRAFYTEDAVMMPFGHILATLSDHPMPEYWDVGGPDMDREAAEHEGGTFEFLDATQNGNMVVTTGQWTFPEGMFQDSESTVIMTASVSHLRGGKIWRQFGDFEVYVDGELIDM
mgnify:FL=1